MDSVSRLGVWEARMFNLLYRFTKHYGLAMFFLLLLEGSIASIPVIVFSVLLGSHSFELYMTIFAVAFLFSLFAEQRVRRNNLYIEKVIDELKRLKEEIKKLEKKDELVEVMLEDSVM